ncbi:hypothetical protein QWY90_07260 [Flavobacterium paronense]|uniref:Coat protein n=1 Tax=Flavobacterium paronense TaxID=1392775 RepID=A0ABV5GGN7_9FLAO|nr:hypothetical protein [Flavobacterium paronense]MDN3677108.1 hypothetical protein [Flavobacterium paronense]
MATIKNNKMLSGTIGPLVFREVYNKQVAQGKRKNIKQTKATKKSASEFGVCSRWAKNLRIGLTPLLVGQTDSTMHQRFTTTVYNAIRTNTSIPLGERNPFNTAMDSLLGFEFNTHSPFKGYFKPTFSTERTTTNEVVITLPDFDPSTAMGFPMGCCNAKLLVFAYATDFKETTIPLVFHNMLSITQNNVLPAQELLHTTPIPEGYFVLAAVKLLYYNPNLLTERNYLNTKEFSPVMVVMAEAT